MKCGTYTFSKVVRMPVGETSVMADFLRFHRLVRTFGGDPDAWLAELRERDENDGDVRFARWVRARLRRDPSLIEAIRRMVDTSAF